MRLRSISPHQNPKIRDRDAMTSPARFKGQGLPCDHQKPGNQRPKHTDNFAVEDSVVTYRHLFCFFFFPHDTPWIRWLTIDCSDCSASFFWGVGKNRWINDQNKSAEQKWRIKRYGAMTQKVNGERMAISWHVLTWAALITVTVCIIVHLYKLPLFSLDTELFFVTLYHVVTDGKWLWGFDNPTDLDRPN